VTFARRGNEAVATLAPKLMALGILNPPLAMGFALRRRVPEALIDRGRT